MKMYIILTEQWYSAVELVIDEKIRVFADKDKASEYREFIGKKYNLDVIVLEKDVTV